MNSFKLTEEFTSSFENNNVVAVKVKVESADYIGKAPKASSNPLVNVGSQMYNWLFDPLFNA